ncbi:hypothetical protein HPB49_023500 [Dermacentor silvarum]|uniref:Uncharacterized protein n=1 Tax=Dermacentor silvarum TaxID=543639 RepID=A0ACB8CHW1_DERSI|nr:hypothetical protein HPB49_023500 [Dermacentor silvarum]
MATPARDVLRLLKTNIDPQPRTSRTCLSTTPGANAVTRTSILVRVCQKRNPHVQFSGVDPGIGPDEFINILYDRNQELDLDLEKCKVRVTFRERAGTRAYVAEVDPEAYRKIMSRPRLSVGWTSVRYEWKTRPYVCCSECGRAGREITDHPTGFSECPVLVEKGRGDEEDGRLSAVRIVYFGEQEDPLSVIVVRRPNFDVYPVYISRCMAAVRCTREARTWRVVAAYAPPHCSMDPTLDAFAACLDEESAQVVIVMGDLNAKHMWGLRANDNRYQWKASSDETFSEHKAIHLVLYSANYKREKRPTKCGMHNRTAELKEHQWFERASGADIRSTQALDAMLEKMSALVVALECVGVTSIHHPQSNTRRNPVRQNPNQQTNKVRALLARKAWASSGKCTYATLLAISQPVLTTPVTRGCSRKIEADTVVTTGRDLLTAAPASDRGSGTRQTMEVDVASPG